MDTVQGQVAELRAAVARFLNSWDCLRGPEVHLGGLEALWRRHEAMGEAWAEHRAALRGLTAADRDLALVPFGLRLEVSGFLANWQSRSASGDNGLPLQLARRHLKETFDLHLHAADISTL